jgi:hypothetical protein
MNPEFENVLKAEQRIQASRPKFLMGASVFFVGVLVFFVGIGVSANSVDSIAFVFIGCAVLAVTLYVLSVSHKQAKLNLEIVKALQELQVSVRPESNANSPES